MKSYILAAFTVLFLSTASFAETAKQIFVARVIYAEALTCSDYERVCVASVMMGRIHHPGFDDGDIDDMYDAASQKGAFSCINDPDNHQWKKSAHPNTMTKKEKAVYDHCLSLARGEFKQVMGKNGASLVYYFDHSITEPKSWTNRYWKTITEIVTPNFTFLSVKKR